MDKTDTLLVYSSRPEYIKIKPLIGILNANTLHIGQHTSIIDFGKPDYFFNIDKEGGEGRLPKIMSEISLKAPEIFKKYQKIIVQGDTASVFGAALTAFQMKKKIIHLEAGLRSYDLDNPFPEEGYRQMVSRITDIHLCPTDLAAQTLKAEKARGMIYVVGNTVLDNLVGTTASYGTKVLVTIHRNENLPQITEILNQIDQAAKENPKLDFVFPYHPNPIIKKAALKLKYINVFPAVEHSYLIDIISKCRFLVTDSGGCCEEGSFFGKKSLVIRKATERREGVISGHFQMCPDVNIIKDNINHLCQGDNHEIYSPCPFGDGNSANRIKEVLENA